MKNYKTIIAADAAGLACTAITSQASFTPVSPGVFATIPSGGDFTAPAAGDLLATLTSNFNFGPNIDIGSVTTSVYKFNAANGAPLGGLLFIYTVVVNTGDITGLTVNGFTGPVSVNNVAGTAQDANSANDNITGGINFSWGPNVNAVNTVKVVVDTSATTWAGNTANFQDSAAGIVPSLGPVPEPSTVVAGALMLLPFGIGAIRSLRKDRTA